MARFWVSWWDPNGDFELFWPWWATGQRETDDDDEEVSICAALEASSEEEVEEFIRAAYDAPKDLTLEFRFIEERDDDWSPFSSRFPKAQWMRWPSAST